MRGPKEPRRDEPEAAALARALSRKRPKGGQMSLRAVSARDGASRAVIIRLGKAFELLDHGSQISCIRDNRIKAARLAEISFQSSQGLRRQNALTHRPRAQRFASPTSNRHDQKFPFLRIPRMGMGRALSSFGVSFGFARSAPTPGA